MVLVFNLSNFKQVNLHFLGCKIEIERAMHLVGVRLEKFSLDNRKKLWMKGDT